MFKSSGWVFCLVVMAAFVFGCGGGGGTAQMPDSPPGTTPSPEPTDQQRIAQARQSVATILLSAQTRAGTSREAASALRINQDATADQITRAGDQNTAVQDALADIVSANADALAATTPAAAQAAQTAATTAQNILNIAADAIGAIQRAVQVATDARTRREMNQIALTNNSSLIQHVRDNKLVSDAILKNLGLVTGNNANPLIVGNADNTINLATYPADDTTSTPRVPGVRGVTVTVGGTAFTSDSKTSALNGTGSLPHGFDPKNPAAPGTFVNAYTDITKTRKNVPLTRRGDNPATTDTTEVYTHSYTVRMDVADADYLVAGIWLDSNNVLKAFAYGSQPLNTDRTANPNANFLECWGVATDGDHTCTDATSFANIADFVADGQAVSATYRGDANGVYLAGGDSSYFTGDVELNAEFNNPAVGANNGSIEGEITNIKAGRQDIVGSIELQQHTFADAIGDGFGGAAVGVVDGKSFGGLWEGQFFGQRVSSARKIPGRTAGTSVTTFSAQAPGSVAGTFYAAQQSAPVRDAAFIGAFSAKR